MVILNIYNIKSVGILLNKKIINMEFKKILIFRRMS